MNKLGMVVVAGSLSVGCRSLTPAEQEYLGTAMQQPLTSKLPTHLVHDAGSSTEFRRQV